MKQLPQQWVRWRIVNALRALGYASVALLLHACSEVPAALEPLQDYQTRVANTLDRTPIAYQPVPTPTLPTPRELQQDIDRISLSLLDAWRIEQCPLGQLVAERNSALGRLQSGLTRYQHDRALTHALAACQQTVAAQDPALAARLGEAYQAKRATLTKQRQQALGEDPALRHSLHISDRSLSAIDEGRFASSLTALETVVYVVEQAPETAPLANAELESALETLHQNTYLPELWRSLWELKQYLQQLEPLVVELAQASGCSSKGRPARAEILHTVFLKYFIQRVQPHLAEIVSQGQQAATQVARLRQIVSTPSYQTYLVELESLATDVTQLSRAHVAPWQEFFTDCGFQPGA